MTTLKDETTANLGGGDGMTTLLTASESRIRLGSVWRAGLLAALVAAAGNVLVYTLARALGTSFLMTFQPGAEPLVLPVVMVILASLAGAAAGTVAFALLGRFAPGQPGLFSIVGLVFLLLSFAGPLTLESADAATRATLMLMHVVAGASTIGLLSWRGRR